MIGHLAIIGVGLIGGSLALSLRQQGQCGQVTGCGRDTGNLDKAVELGVIDDYRTDPAEAVCDAEMVVLAVPMGAMQSVMAAIRPGLRDDAVITDVGSAKQTVLQAAVETLGEHASRFVPGHPIAGNERSGVTAAVVDLFQGRRVILTPHEDNDEAAIGRVQAMWQACGAEVTQMDAASHDHILADTSHLPHLLAFSLVRELANSPHHDDIFRYAAGGLRDFTRIAESDPVMWRDICVANRDAILHSLARYRQELMRLEQAVADADQALLTEMFQQAHDARAHFRRLLDKRERGNS